jgi:ATP-dependent Clp endopeptidase proteolytic subunit ClpP
MRYTVNVDPRIQIKDIENSCQMPTYVRFGGNFTEDSAVKFCEELQQAEDRCIKSGQEVLPIVIDSYGGDVYALFSMIDMVQACKVKIATVVEGKAMSCGAVLFTCGAEGYRFIAPNATVMIHEVSSHHFGKNEEIKSSAVETDRLNSKIMKLMARNCGKKENYFEDLVHEKRHADWYLDANECIYHNLANHIAIPRFTVDIKFEQRFDWLVPGSINR